MSPGNRAIDMIMETLREQEIERRVRAGEPPMEVLFAVWDGNLRYALGESRLDGDVLDLCMAALDRYESELALSQAQGALPYRTAALTLPEPPAREPSVWERLRLLASAVIPRDRAARK